MAGTAGFGLFLRRMIILEGERRLQDGWGNVMWGRVL